MPFVIAGLVGSLCDVSPSQKGGVKLDKVIVWYVFAEIKRIKKILVPQIKKKASRTCAKQSHVSGICGVI